MSEICFDCYNKLSGGKDSKIRYIISRDLDLCEECGKLRPVIIRMKRYYLYRELLIEWIADMRTLYGRNRNL